MDFEEEIEQLKNSLPKAPYLSINLGQFIKFKDFWLHEPSLHQTLNFQRNFQARDTDLIITSIPKTGSTWLKSLLFATVTRTLNPLSQNALLNTHSHELVVNLEHDLYGVSFAYPRPQHLDELPSPRMFSTHLPYTLLPESVKVSSKCRLLYICRNPLDTIVSFYYFITSFLKRTQNETDDIQPPRFEEIFDEFCQGKCLYGPFFEHVFGYWKVSLDQPDKVLFLKYEDLKDDPAFHLKRIADFIGMSFSLEEVNEGVIDQIIELCSIGNMKELEVNKSGLLGKFIGKDTFFRKGEVGDWTNHFTPAMTEKITKLMDEKLDGTGLSFKLHP